MMVQVMLGCALAVLPASLGCGQSVAPNAAAVFGESKAAYDRGDDKAVVAQTDAFIARHPSAQESGEAYYLRALAEIRLGRTEQARQDLLKTIELARRSDLIGLAHLTMGQLAQKQNDDAAAEQHYRLAASALPGASPSADEVLLRLGQVLQRRGQWEQADLQYDRLIYLYPDSAWAKPAQQAIRARAWTVQAGVSRDRRRAEAMAEPLRQAGLEPKVVPVMNDEVALAVQVGRFSTYNEAGQTLTAARAVVGSAIITTAR